MKLPIPTQITVSDHYAEFGDGKVVRCKKFNRKSCWEQSDKDKWYSSVQKGWNINPLIYIEIDSCIKLATEKGNEIDRKYFENYKVQGYKYITIEGGNRNDATENFYQTFPQYRDKGVNIAVIESVTREEMHEGYVRLAHGVSPNRQEKRTGIFGEVSDLVRKTSEKLATMWDRVKSVKRTRMADDEVIAMLINFTSNQSFGKSILNGEKKDDVLDTIYTTNKFNKTNFNYLIKNLKDIFDSIVDYDEITTKLPKTTIYLLSMILMSIKDKYRIPNFDLFVQKWYDKYLERDNSDEIVFKRKGKSLVFTQLLSGLVMDTDQLKTMDFLIESDFIPFLEQEEAIAPHNPEEFTKKHKRDWINDNKFEKDGKWYVTVRNNTPDLSLRGVTESEFITITLAEAFNGSKFELDHIKPKSKGGETTLENAELTTKQYNRKKRAKILND